MNNNNNNNRDPSIDEIIKKHSAKIEQQIKNSNVEKVNYSQSYSSFKEEMSPELTKYEQWCKSLGNLIKVKVSKKEEAEVKKNLEIAHLDLDPSQPMALGIMAFLTVFIFGGLFSVVIYLFTDEFPALFFLLILFVGLFVFNFLNSYPLRLASKWRLKASSQMMPAILYIVVYMRHTPNLEKAISFASQHLPYPLGLDFKKIFYDVQIGKFSTIKESLDNYLDGWKDYSIEFIEAFHLIESSLFEPDDSKRISTLDKSLQVILEGVYDKMLRFTHDVRSPLTNVYMLGVVLPTLGLALLPLASTLIGDILKWYHVLILFNLIIPFFVFFLTDKIMFLRPGGYGETSLIEKNPLYPQYKSKKPYIKAFLICLPLFLIGLLPLLFRTPIPGLLGLQSDYTLNQIGIPIGEDLLFDFKSYQGKIVGPFGSFALFLSIFFSLGVALFFAISFKLRTKELIKEKEKTKQLEIEFNNSLFQLGNRIGNGTPPEIVFSKIAESTKGLNTEDFFRRTSYNIMQLGMSVENALFDPKRGVLVYYPSELIATSMKILVESAKKGLIIAASSLISLSEYVKNMRKITDRLRDLLAEIISDMKSNMTFLAPLLSGVIIGLSAMITSILNKLSIISEGQEVSGEIAGYGSIESISNIFQVEKMIPPYILQLMVGIYLIEIIFILTRTLVIIDTGDDKLEQTNKTGINLKKGMVLYVIAASISVLLLSLLTSIVLGSSLG